MKNILIFTTLALSVGLVAATAQNRTPTLTTVTATVQDSFVRPLAGGNAITKTVSGQFYRDAQGRTCIVRGQVITIQDPSTRTVVVVDMSSKTAKRFVASQSPSPGPSMSAVTGKQAQQDLGTQVISGVSVQGSQFTVVLPAGAIGNLGPLTETNEVWRSNELGLAIQTKSTDPVNGEHTQLFSNIVTGAPIDSSLFSVPAGVQVVDVQPATRSGTQKFR